MVSKVYLGDVYMHEEGLKFVHKETHNDYDQHLYWSGWDKYYYKDEESPVYYCEDYLLDC
jgi:hypothetical protein